MTSRSHIAAWLLGLGLGALAPEAARGAGTEVGEEVENARLPVLGGGRGSLLGEGEVSVFVFFRPGQDHSLDTLRQLAGIERELASKPVHFCAVVSGSRDPAEVRAAVQEAGVRMPVLVDEGDALYEKLGVRLHPVVGVVDGKRRLAAWEPFEKVNYAEVIRARILRALGEISEAELGRALAPARATMPGEDPRLVAKRDLRLGRMLLERGSPEKALEAARRAEERAPGFSAPHTLAGEALAGMGRCSEARDEFEAALRLDPGDAGAAQGRRSCVGR